MLSVAMIAFFVGFQMGDWQWGLYAPIRNAEKTLRSVIWQASPPFAVEQFLDWSTADADDVTRHRIVINAPAPDAGNDEHFLISGGLNQFLEYCPEHGCIAVEFTRSGTLVHAYPYRPDQFPAHQIISLPYEEIGFRFGVNMVPHGFLKLPDGDLIVTFNQWNSFPYQGGIARVRLDGSVAWFRHDYSHHWPRLLPDGDIVVPGMRIGPSTVSEPLIPGTAMTTRSIWDPRPQRVTNIALDCEGKIMEDVVRILDPDGRVTAEIPVFDAFKRSPYRAMLMDVPECDPLHLNYVVPVTSGITALYNDVSSDDLVVSLHNLSAFAILGRHDHRLKHLFRGTFVHQHSVQPLGQSATMLIFDNHGGGRHGGPSRFLAYDLAERQERTLLPNPNAPGVKMFSDVDGNISVSPDDLRAIVASSREGRAYEVRISDGRVLTTINDLQDLRKVPAAGGPYRRKAAWFALDTVTYVR